MNVEISNSERKTLFGGRRYVLHAKVQVTPEEGRIIKKTSLGRYSLFDNIEKSVGQNAYMRLLKRGASFASRYTGDGMANEFEELAAMKNFESILTRGLQNWKRQIELQLQASEGLGKSKNITL